MAKKKDKVYVATLWRFGHDLTTVGHTEEEAKEALMEAYVKAYKNINDCDPRFDDYAAYNLDDIDNEVVTTYYDNAAEDIEIKEFEFGKVEWF